MMRGIFYVLLRIKRRTAHFAEQRPLPPRLFMRKSDQTSLAREKLRTATKTHKTTHFFSKTNLNVNKTNVKLFMIRGRK